MTDSNQEKEIIKETTKEVLQAMNIVVQMNEEEIKETENGEKIFTINLESADPSILIGQSGGNLQALQYIVKLLAHRKIKALNPETEGEEFGERKMIRINLDINDYKKQREDSLQELARGMAEQVLSNKNSIALRPMSSYERRIVHLEIAKHPELATESLGDEPFRKIVIKVKE